MKKQVKFIVGSDLDDLANVLNDYLLEVDAETDITYDFDKNIAVVEVMKASPSHVCCECKHWDDKGDNQALLGECPIRMKRTRYNDGACSQFK